VKERERERERKRERERERERESGELCLGGHGILHTNLSDAKAKADSKQSFEIAGRRYLNFLYDLLVR
jgi:hypothetical protein